VQGIRQRSPGEGLNVYLRYHAVHTLELALDDEAIVSDMDTPEDYQRLQHRQRREV
jgi:CTP:molybdopterin cytidylyltransferase MocA